jgi:hypothetical protein
MRTIIYTLLLILGLDHAKAQTLDSVLNLVRAQNKTLKVHAAEAEASKMAFKTGLNPENPTIEYEMLFGSPKEAGNQQDIRSVSIFQQVTGTVNRHLMKRSGKPILLPRPKDRKCF